MNKIICPDCFENIDNLNNISICEFCESGLILNERYYLLEIVGHNIGVTYKALEIETKNKVIIKELSIKNIKDWKEEELFTREADTLTSISNSQIPKFIDFFKIKLGRNIKYYTVIELIYGKTLQEEIIEKDYSENEVINIIKEISKILDYLHSFTPPIIHRDIKPSNIIKRKQDGKYVLIDFGAVTDALKPQGNNTIAGTLGYMAPEQFMGKPCIESDYYSLGVLALELLTKESPEELMSGISLDWENLDLSTYMKKILSYFLDQDPSKRISSYKDLVNILNEVNSNVSEKPNLKEDSEKINKMFIELINKRYIKKKDSFSNKEFLGKVLVTLGFVALTIIDNSNIPFLLTFLLFMTFYSGMREERKNIKEKNKQLNEYFSKLSEKEIVYLEIILNKQVSTLFINKDEFYELYQDAIDEEKIDMNLIIKYREQYKDAHKSI